MTIFVATIGGRTLTGGYVAHGVTKEGTTYRVHARGFGSCWHKKQRNAVWLKGFGISTWYGPYTSNSFVY